MPVQATDLLERDFELSELAALSEATRGGGGGVVVAEGAAGIGKSRLLESAAEAARGGGVTVLRARGSELEREFPFGVVRQLLEPPVRAAAPAERRALLSGAAELALPLFETQPVTPAPGDASFAVLHGLYWLCANLAGSVPLLLEVDDGHWADSPSLRFLNYLAARLEGLRVGIVVGARQPEPGPGGDLLRALAATPATRLLRLSPLSEPAAAQLVRAKLAAAAPEFCRACYEATGGNPFLLYALITALKADGVSPTASAAAVVSGQAPAEVSRSVLWRLSRLPASAAAEARAVAVLGLDARLSQAAELASLDTAGSALAVDQLASEEILTANGVLSFVHPLVQSAVYADIPATQRNRDHARAAKIVARDGGATERVAAHLLVVEPDADDWTVDVLRESARQAIERGAPESAAVYLRRALAEVSPASVRAELLRNLGLAEAMSGDPAGIEHLTDALALTEDPHEHAGLALALARVLIVAGRPAEAVPLLERELAQFGDLDRELAMRLEAQRLAAAALQASTRRSGRTTRFGHDLEGKTPAERALLANFAAWDMVEGGTADHVAELAERALGNGELLAEETADSQIFYCATNTLYMTDRLEPAARWFEAALVDASRRGSLIGFALATCFRGQVAFYTGHLAEALADAHTALDIAGPMASGPFDIGLAYLIDALIERGELTAAERALENRALPAEVEDSLTTIFLVASRARLHIARGDHQPAIEDLSACEAWFTEWGADSAFTSWRAEAALAYSKLGDREQAQRLANEDVKLARAFGAPRPLGIALRAAGLVEGGDHGTELLGEAVAVLEHSPARLEYARALTDLGAALRRADHRKAAREPLRQGLELADRCGATVLAERAAAELHATGARPRRLVLTGIDALTPSERRVAQMAAKGDTNAEVAQALFVSPKTIDTHLQHAYQKLDIHSRAQLRQALNHTA